MTAFILIAIALTACAAALVVIPLTRIRADDTPPRAPGVAIITGAVIAIGAAALYMTLSNWSWRAPVPPTTPEGMVAQLARRMERNPEDLNGWLMLGRSYTVLEQFSLAARAYQRADRLAGGKNVDAMIGLAEALALGDEKQLDGRAGRLIENAVALDPKSGKALYYGAALALRRGELALARQRFASLLVLDPPAKVKPLLEAQIAAIDRELAPLPH
jgi:cytochrome c-type biogenesis protein CcmH